MKQSIHLGLNRPFTADLFNLPCVAAVIKMKDGGYYLFLTDYMTEAGRIERAYQGDTLVEGDDGLWKVIKNNNQ